MSDSDRSVEIRDRAAQRKKPATGTCANCGSQVERSLGLPSPHSASFCSCGGCLIYTFTIDQSIPSPDDDIDWLLDRTAALEAQIATLTKELAASENALRMIQQPHWCQRAEDAEKRAEAAEAQSERYAMEAYELTGRLMAAEAQRDQCREALRGLIGYVDDPTPYDKATTLAAGRAALSVSSPATGEQK